MCGLRTIYEFSIQYQTHTYHVVARNLIRGHVSPTTLSQVVFPFSSYSLWPCGLCRENYLTTRLFTGTCLVAPTKKIASMRPSINGYTPAFAVRFILLSSSCVNLVLRPCFVCLRNCFLTLTVHHCWCCQCPFIRPAKLMEQIESQQ